MKKFIFPLGLAAMLTVSCSDDTTSPELDDSNKTGITLFSTDNTASAGVSIDGNTRAGFTTANTYMVMRMKAVKDGSTSDIKYTKTSANAGEDPDAQHTTKSAVTFSNNEIRYWDDAYGRKTQLSIFAVAVPEKANGNIGSLNNLNNLKGDATWSTTDSGDNTLSWKVSTTQTSTTIDEQDLVYSNNIRESYTEYNKYRGVLAYDFTNKAHNTFSGKYSLTTVGDYSDQTSPENLKSGMMKFRAAEGTNAETDPGKFDYGNLNFVHALSRMTIKVKYSNEFASDAVLTEEKLLNMPTEGTFDVDKGEFTTTSATANVDMAKYTPEGSDLTAGADGLTVKEKYMGQMLPGYKIKENDNTNIIKLEVKEASKGNVNQYYITQAKVYEALKTAIGTTANEIVMEQGKNYILTITVKKAGIDNITATLADWTEIKGSTERNNAYLEFTFDKHGSTDADNFNVYRLQDSGVTDITITDPMAYNWNGGFGASGTTWANGYVGATPSANGTYNNHNVWKVDNWYWDDNKSFYHFRTVGNSIGLTDIKTETINGKNYNYFTVKGGNSDGNYRWGAPFVTGKSLQYDKTNGFDYDNNAHHISQAIGATNSYIDFTHINMLSNIRVNVKTTSGNDHVKLYVNGKGTTVKLTRIYKDGKVYMGNGRVVPTGDRTAETEKTQMSYVRINTTSNTKESYTGTDDDTYDLKGFYDYFAVPQELVGDNTYVGLEIQTPDDNIYFVVQKLSEIIVSSHNDKNPNLGQQKDGKITYWYPNCIYNYTITVTKTGIKAITCTLADWTVINGADQNIGLED